MTDSDPGPGDGQDRARDLLERAIDGDRRAAEGLWQWVRETAHRMAIALCRRRGVARDRVEDVVQNAILGLVRRPLTMLLELDSLQAFLHRVVRNSVVDEWRRVKRHRDAVVASLDEERAGADGSAWTLGDCLASGDDTAMTAARREQIRVAEQFLERQPKERAEIFRLRVVEGWKYKDIAERMACPIGTVGVVIFHLKRKLHALWDELDLRGNDR